MALGIRNRLTALTLLLVAASGCTTLPEVRSCVHRNAEIEQSIGYCQAVRAGNDLHVSGVTGAGPMEAAVPKVYEALRDILRASGLSYADVIQETVYTTDLDAFIALKDRRKEFYGGALPAATWVQVQRLYRPNYVLEVELVARFPARP